MSINELLKASDHRPWPIPQTPWKFYQEWNQVVFLHWEVEPSLLKEFLPRNLEIALIDGKAWVSIVAFTMENIRPRNLFPFPPVSTFYELNVRTYVKRNGKLGVYFLSMEGGKRLSCYLAKKISGLPYRYSNMKRTPNRFSSSNDLHSDQFQVSYIPGKKIIDKSPLDRWLTERYAVFQDVKGDVVDYNVHHAEWEVHDLDVSDLTVDYPRFQHLLIGNPVRLHYSPGVRVVSWGKNE